MITVILLVIIACILADILKELKAIKQHLNKSNIALNANLGKSKDIEEDYIHSTDKQSAKDVAAIYCHHQEDGSITTTTYEAKE